MSAQITGLDDLNKELTRLRLAVGSKKTLQKISRKASKPVVEAARRNAPQLKKGEETYRYDTPKLIGKLRAPKGFGRVVATYKKGNLAGAIRALNLRKTIYAIIGPFIRKRGDGAGTYGPGTRRFDGYYAQMVFGSAVKFQRKVMISALQSKAASAKRIIAKEIDIVIKENT